MNVIGGKAYSWPISGQTGYMMLFWNTKLFKAAGLKGADGGSAVPQSWADMRLFARKITELGEGEA